MIAQFKLVSASLIALALAVAAPQAQAKSAGEGQTCGGVGAIQCSSGLYCQMATGMCHKPDAAGVCKARPEVCTQDVRPVCGCDGKTYTNACRAHQAGQSVESMGACPKSK